MNRPLIARLPIAFSIAALLFGSFLPNGARSQTVRPVAPVPVPVPIIPPVMTGPSIAVPRIEQRIDPQPSLAPVPSISTAPVTASAAPAAAKVTVIVPGSGPRIERESPDCSVHQFSCAEACDPLPSGWASNRQCLRYQCKQVDEGCLEKLARELTSRRRESQVTFNIECEYPYAIQIAFYSQDRNVSWPGNNMAYSINDYRTHEYKLSCKSGEQICYGAWPRSSLHWGVGLNDQYGCQNCCARCDGGTHSYVLGKG
jgi:hypothetical protein